MKPRDPNRSDSARAMDVSSVARVAKLSAAGEGTAEIVNPTCVFPTIVNPMVRNPGLDRRRSARLAISSANRRQGLPRFRALDR